MSADSPVFLSLDFGTSSVKAALLDEHGTLFSRASAPYDYLILPGEKNELCPDALLSAMESAANALDENGRRRVSCLCYDTFSPSPVFLTDDGALACPNVITHLDRRARAYSAKVDKTFGNDAYMKISGFLPFAGGCSLMTILWFLDNAPDVLKRTRTIAHLPTYLYFLFTGKIFCDRVNASMLGVYDTVGDTGWSEGILRAFSLKREWFPEIRQPGERLGALLPGMADRLGVPRGVPVALGTNDMAASQVGADNRAPGGILNSAGSSDMIGIITDQPLPDARYYLRCAADKGLWQMYATTVGGFAVDWFYEQFCREMPSKSALYASMDSAVKQFLSDESVSFAPYLAGDRQSLTAKTAAWEGLTLSSTREQMLVAMLRGFQGALAGVMRAAEEKIPLKSQIKITGGMLSDAYLAVKAAAFRGYTFARREDCALRGNAVLAL